MSREPYRYLVEYRGRCPASLWRVGDTWQYWSLIHWAWTGLTCPQVPGPPPARRLRQVSTVEACELVADRQRWVHYWAVYRRRELAGPDRPTTVIRRRYSPDGAYDEVFGIDHHGWNWTDTLVRHQTGRGSSLPPLQRIDRQEAERILQHSCGVVGATTWWDQLRHDPAAPGWHGTGRDTGRHLPEDYEAQAHREYQRARRTQPQIDQAIRRVVALLHPDHGAAHTATDTLKTWPAYRRNVASTWESGEPAEEATIQTDLHRYTLTTPDQRYQEGLPTAMSHLEQTGFAPVPGTHLDMWDTPIYKGINTVWRHRPTGRLVEILFHTRASFVAMLAGAPQYEVLRCRYLDDGKLTVTPAHRDYARALLALTYDPEVAAEIAEADTSAPSPASQTSPPPGRGTP